MKNLLTRNSFLRLITVLLAMLVTMAASLPMPDPTKPPDILIPASKNIRIGGALQLNGTFIYPDHRFALINGNTVNLGDTIGEYTIINIHHDTVELKGTKDSSMILTLFPKVKSPRQ